MEEYLTGYLVILNGQLVKDPKWIPELMIQTIRFIQAEDNPILAIIYNVEVFTGQGKGDEICDYLWMVPRCLLFISRYHCSKGCAKYALIAIDRHVSFHMRQISNSLRL